jgi:hypothetical protein
MFAADINGWVTAGLWVACIIVAGGVMLWRKRDD